MLVCFLLVCQHNVQAQSVALGEQSETVSSVESSLYQNPKAKGKATYTDDLMGYKKEASSSLENKSKKQKKQKKLSTKRKKKLLRKTKGTRKKKQKQLLPNLQ